MNLEVKKLQNPKYRVVYHAHTTNIIALTFVLPLEDRVFTRELWRWQRNVRWYSCRCRRGAVDGSGRQGDRGCNQRADEKYDLAIWAHHGMFAAGEDFDVTFGLMHTAEKSAEILVKTLSMRRISSRRYSRMTSDIWQRIFM